MDITAWLNGAYVAKAIAMLGKKKYPERPLDVFGVLDDERTEHEQIVSKAEGFRAFAIMFNHNRHKQKQLEGSEDNGTAS